MGEKLIRFHQNYVFFIIDLRFFYFDLIGIILVHLSISLYSRFYLVKNSLWLIRIAFVEILIHLNIVPQ